MIDIHPLNTTLIIEDCEVTKKDTTIIIHGYDSYNQMEYKKQIDINNIYLYWMEQIESGFYEKVYLKFDSETGELIQFADIT